jgi:ferredoxin-like protein FixX
MSEKTNPKSDVFHSKRNFSLKLAHSACLEIGTAEISKQKLQEQKHYLYFVAKFGLFSLISVCLNVRQIGLK